MADAAGRGGDDIDGAHHAGRKLVEDGGFQARDGVEARMVGRSRCEVDARAPSFVKRVGRRIDHAGKSLDALQLAHRRRGQDRLDGGAQAFVVDGPGEAAGQPNRCLLEGHDLKAMTAIAGRRQTHFSHGQAAMNNNCRPLSDGH